MSIDTSLKNWNQEDAITRIRLKSDKGVYTLRYLKDFVDRVQLDNIY